MSSTIIKNVQIVNEGKSNKADVFIENDRIKEIKAEISEAPSNCLVLDAEGLVLLPGAIDDQVHFREPGAYP
jgi:dihydroorotase